MGRITELLTQQIKNIEVDSIKDWTKIEDISTKILEEQKVYFWIRLFLKEENSNLQIGDDINIKYLPSGEKLQTKFICYGKEGLQKNVEDEIVNFNPEDDKKTLCLMIDEKIVNTSDEIPFIRTLFKNGRFYEYQLVRRDELIFENGRTCETLDYFDCDF